MLPNNILEILNKDKIEKTDQDTLFNIVLTDFSEEGSYAQLLIDFISGDYTKEKTRILVDVMSSIIITFNSKEARALLEHELVDAKKCSRSNIFLLTELCTKANYFDSLAVIRRHTNTGILDYCNAPMGVITDWKNSIQSPQDLINKYVKDKHSEFSAWKALKFMGTVAGCAIFIWGNIQPILKENQKFNALVACLGLSAAVVTGFSSYFFKVDASSHGVPNELFTAR